jgi:hypothetical protein
VRGRSAYHLGRFLYLGLLWLGVDEHCEQLADLRVSVVVDRFAELDSLT